LTNAIDLQLRVLFVLCLHVAGSTPYTPSLSMLYGLKESIGMLKSEGMDNVVARHHRLAEGTRKAVEGWGLELLCAHPR
jgi:alanine-glyoxylate transaminase/serine-glyoxylate transaminase/serine-pyruvate transaminase